MDNDTKVFKLIQKEKPPEEKPLEVTPDDLFKEAIGKYEDAIVIGWKGEQFIMSWSSDYSPEEVNLQLDLAKARLINKLFEFD